MRSLMVGLLVAAPLAVGGWVQAADIESGPEIGGRTTPFNVKDITGPKKGQSLCYR